MLTFLMLLSHVTPSQVASVLLILHTSAMVLSIGGLFKDVLLVSLSYIFFASPVTYLQVLIFLFLRPLVVELSERLPSVLP
jgi:hypothetical protein